MIEQTMLTIRPRAFYRGKDGSYRYVSIVRAAGELIWCVGIGFLKEISRAEFLDWVDCEVTDEEWQEAHR
jgi:hypothetical protein